MLRRLRIKFVCINMLIVTVMLSGIFGTVLFFTAKNMEAESVRMMHAIATRPQEMEAPDEFREEIRLPYFTLQIDQDGHLSVAAGGYFDLSDEEYLREVLGCRPGHSRPDRGPEKLQSAFLPGGDAHGSMRGLYRYDQ